MDENSPTITLEYLKCIGIGDNYNSLPPASIQHYMSLTTKYASKMERVKAYSIQKCRSRGFFDDGGAATRAIAANNANITSYLSHFSSLTHVSVALSGPLSIRTVLDLCPKLEQLELMEQRNQHDMDFRAASWTSLDCSFDPNIPTVYHNLKVPKIEESLFEMYGTTRDFFLSHLFLSLTNWRLNIMKKKKKQSSLLNGSHEDNSSDVAVSISCASTNDNQSFQ